MIEKNYLPLVEITRGNTVESIHYGAIAVANSDGELVASYGNPQTTSFLRSAAKVFQAIPLIEAGGHEHFKFTEKEIALLCSSHTGTDAHLETVQGIQSKIGISESDLLCGSHRPYDLATSDALIKKGESPGSNRHNCSGKHTGMLALALYHGLDLNSYLEMSHPIQKQIVASFADMCRMDSEELEMGIDGCSAPNFSVPLANAAYAWASMADPAELHPKRQKACKTIVNAILAHPDMVAGPKRFDTAVMQAGNGFIVSKGGAEGYQGVGILPGALGENSPALGVALKISDGDHSNRAAPLVALEILRQLGVISEKAMTELKAFGPSKDVLNWKKIVVGKMRSCFKLNYS